MLTLFCYRSFTDFGLMDLIFDSTSVEPQQPTPLEKVKTTPVKRVVPRFNPGSRIVKKTSASSSKKGSTSSSKKKTVDLSTEKSGKRPIGEGSERPP